MKCLEKWGHILTATGVIIIIIVLLFHHQWIFFFWSLNTEKKYIIQDIPGGNSPKKYRHAPQIAIS